MSWECLADVKESNPMEVAMYAMSQCRDHEAAFSWWVLHALNMRNQIISAVKKHYLKRMHKSGIAVRKTVCDAMQLDQENSNHHWMDAAALEIVTVGIAFKQLSDRDNVPVGYQFI
jgi:hypothetical protein